MDAANSVGKLFQAFGPKTGLRSALARAYGWPLAILILFCCCISNACAEPESPNADIRPPAVAGKFYPSDPQKLRLAIHQFLQNSTDRRLESPIAILVPHAGYVYAGQIYADAYRQVMGHQYDSIVILGVNHTTGGFRGISLGDYSSFRTPLGDAPVDLEVVSALMKECSDCSQKREVHAREHSIEVQIPFIQVLFPNTKIVPAIIHPPDFDMCLRFGQALYRVLKNRRALIVISTDLSHYPASPDAAKIDRSTLETIARLEPKPIAELLRVLDAPALETRACGEAAILTGITAAKSLGARSAVIAGYANSGDVPIGDPSSTVGYGAIVLVPGSVAGKTRVFDRTAPPPVAVPLQNSEKKILLAYARETITRYLTTQMLPLPRNFPARLNFPQGAFVTIRKAGHLRGCIGHMSPDYELGKVVGMMAMQAAFNDPRFPPLQASELKNLEIEISVLTPLQPVANSAEIVLGRDGVLLFKAGRSAVFLPQVAVENNWDRPQMLTNLCSKAGLPDDCWQKDANFQIFQAEVFDDK
jgi:MEMO1 family protein